MCWGGCPQRHSHGSVQPSPRGINQPLCSQCFVLHKLHPSLFCCLAPPGGNSHPAHRTGGPCQLLQEKGKKRPTKGTALPALTSSLQSLQECCQKHYCTSKARNHRRFSLPLAEPECWLEMEAPEEFHCTKNNHPLFFTLTQCIAQEQTFISATYFQYDLSIFSISKMSVFQILYCLY